MKMGETIDIKIAYMGPVSFVPTDSGKAGKAVYIAAKVEGEPAKNSILLKSMPNEILPSATAHISELEKQTAVLFGLQGYDSLTVPKSGWNITTATYLESIMDKID
jgi:hypothetical protein